MANVFITGASRGIGLATATAFHAHGNNVAICSRNPLHLEAAKSAHPGLHTFVCDLSDMESVRKTAQSVLETCGLPDILINNGGIYLPGSISDEYPETLETLLDTNVRSAYHFTRAFLPGMKARKSGTIINICSTASLVGFSNGGSYCISKFALHGMTKVLREELKPFGIRVTGVFPGATLTDSWAGVDLPESRFMPAEDIAQMIYTTCMLSARTVVEEIVLRPQEGDIL